MVSSPNQHRARLSQPPSSRKQVAEQFQQNALHLLAQHPDGLPLQTLATNVPEAVPLRTIQRWLAQLVDIGLLATCGRARATRYQLPQGKPYPLSSLSGGNPKMLVMREPEASLSEIPLSPQAQRTLQLVSRPLSQRPAAHYDPSLLQSYEPNVTAYLSEDLREKLLLQSRVYEQAKPAGTHARELANRLLIDLSWNSSRLEGNTYSLLETERLLALGAVSEGKPVADTQMIMNHKVAIEFMLDNAAEIGFNRYTLLNLHAMLSDNLLANPAACGALRKMPVFIGQSSFQPVDTPQQIEDWFDAFLTKAQAIENPFEQSLFALIHLPYLQPFEDVNKRTARLAANIGLFASNLCPLSFVDMPQLRYVQAVLGVYELGQIDLLRDLFVWAYLRSCARYNHYLQVVSTPDPLRMKYRSLLYSTVSEIILAPYNKPQAVAHIRKQAQALVEPADQSRFVEVVETQLMSLHEGNMARYGVKPAQFERWQLQWA